MEWKRKHAMNYSGNGWSRSMHQSRHQGFRTPDIPDYRISAPRVRWRKNLAEQLVTCRKPDLGPSLSSNNGLQRYRVCDSLPYLSQVDERIGTILNKAMILEVEVQVFDRVLVNLKRNCIFLGLLQHRYCMFWVNGGYIREI